MNEPERVAIYPPIRETPHHSRRNRQLNMYREMRDGLDTQVQVKQRDVVQKLADEKEQMR